MSNRRLLEEALRRHGIVDPVRLESHLRGCDLQSDISSVILSEGSSLSVWVRDGGVPGKYGAEVGEDPHKLGIMVEGRHQETYRVHHSMTVVRSTARSFPIGLVNEVGGTGGGIQYLLPPDWLDFVERIA